MPNWIGDIVMATPALAALRAACPDARVVAVGPPSAPALLEGTDLVDDVVVLTSKSVRGAVNLLSRWRFDLGLLLTNSFRSALVFRLAGIPRRVGYAGGLRSFLLTDVLQPGKQDGRHRLPVPMVEAYFRLLESVGVPRGSHRFVLAASDADEQRATEWLEEHGLTAPLVGVHAGSSFGPSKLWYPEKFAAVVDALHEARGTSAVLICGPNEEPLVGPISAACTTPHAVLRTDLGTLKAIVKRLSLLITTDTGPRHFGPAFDVPTVVLMGSTDPRFTNTNLHGTEIVRTGVACSPCQRKVCPLTGSARHACMTELTPQMVVAAADRLLRV